MRKLRLFMSACALMGAMAANAQIWLETDLTTQFSNLTNYRQWNGATGYTATDFCPMVEVNGIGMKQVCERYENTCASTGTVFTASVTGLAAGTYKIELYGAAAFTFGRGFGSIAFTGDLSTATNNDYSAGDKIEEETGVTLYAEAEGVTYGGEIPIYYATAFPDGASTVTLEGVEVGESGTVTIGMSKTSQSTNWHVIQLKSVIATVDAVALLQNLKQEATELLATTYKNYVGEERTNLEAAIAKTPEAETAEAYKAVIDELESGISALKAANYEAFDKFIAEKEKAIALGLDADAVNSITAATAEEAIRMTQELMVGEYWRVSNDFPYGMELGEWTKTGPTGTLYEQHWSGEARPYLEQSGAAWSSGSWEIRYSQDITLPAGNYVFKVAGRQADSDGVTMSLIVTKGEEILGTVSDFPRGDTGLGINVNGVTSFDPEDEFCNDGVGRGFQWRYVMFSLAETTTVNIAVSAIATETHMWVSFCDATVQTDDEANIDAIALDLAQRQFALLQAQAEPLLDKFIECEMYQDLESAYNAQPTKLDEYNNAIEALEDAIAAYADFLNTDYAINVEADANYNVIIVGNSIAKAFDTVTFYVTPAEGYTLSSVNVLFDETPIDVVNGEGGSFSFVMPAGDVTLDIVVEEIVTGINAVATTTKAQIFNANGMSVKALQKGLNIIKSENGSVQKVMVK